MPTRMTNINRAKQETVEVVCVGMLTPAEVYVVENIPDWNTGAKWNYRADFISDDASIVACCVKKWGLGSGLVCNKLGDDVAGNNVFDELESMGVVGRFIKDKNLRTPYEIVISDSKGGRTYFWDRREDLLKTLQEADTAIMKNAKCVYADWYDYPYNLPAIKEAVNQGLPVLINIEDQYLNSHSISELVALATWVQCTPDQTTNTHKKYETCEKLLGQGVEGVIFTGSEDGCLWKSNLDSFSVQAPSVDLIDANGAGAVLSAGFLFGHSQGWDMESSCRFAVAAASKQCELVSPSALPLEALHEVAKDLVVSRC